MAPLAYKPEDAGEDTGERASAKPGRYKFVVDDIQEKEFKSGNTGLNAKLIVGAGSRDVTCYCNFVYSKAALWKLREFFDAIGVDFEHPPELWELHKKEGVADFVVNEKGYLEPKRFLNEGKKPSGARKDLKVTDAPVAEDNLPF